MIKLPPLAETREIVRKLAAESPDKTAECYYAYYGEDDEGITIPTGPMCIAGAVFAHLGATPEELRYLDNEEGNVSNLTERGEIEGPPNAVGYLNDVQRYQDTQHTWSEAVRLADKEWENI